MEVIIRKIEEQDKDELFNMMKVFYASPAVLHKSSDEVLQKDIDECLKCGDLLTCYVLIVDNVLAGYTMLTKCFSTEYGGMCMWVEDIYIKPEFRNKGLSKKLFEYIEKEYDGKVIRFKLEVEKNNIPAIRLYEKNNYKKSDYIVMAKIV